mgnify:CR=1 FL=1
MRDNLNKSNCGKPQNFLSLLRIVLKYAEIAPYFQAVIQTNVNTDTLLGIAVATPFMAGTLKRSVMREFLVAIIDNLHKSNFQKSQNFLSLLSSNMLKSLHIFRL